MSSSFVGSGELLGARREGDDVDERDDGVRHEADPEPGHDSPHRVGGHHNRRMTDAGRSPSSCGRSERSAGHVECHDRAVGLRTCDFAKAGRLEDREHAAEQLVRRLLRRGGVVRVALDDARSVFACEVDGRGEQAGVEALAAVLATDDEAGDGPDVGVIERGRGVRGDLARPCECGSVPGGGRPAPIRPPRRRRRRSARAAVRRCFSSSRRSAVFSSCDARWNSRVRDRPPLALAGVAVAAAAERVLGVVEAVGGRGGDDDLSHPSTLAMLADTRKADRGMPGLRPFATPTTTG